MNCDIVVNISRFNLQVLYSQNKNSYKFFSYNDFDDIPFYIFSDGNDIEVGESAKSKYLDGVDGAYFNYFDLIKDTKAKFLFIDGENKQISHLLIYSLEIILQALFEKLRLPDHITSSRENLNLNLVFASDITDDDINFLVDTFNNFGYKKVKYIYSNYLMLNYLDNNRKIGAFKDNKSNMGAFNGYVVVDSIDNNLQIDFFDTLGNKYPKLHKEGLGLAMDPISELIAKELFEQTAQATGSRTKIKSELPHLLKLAKIQDITKSEFFVKVELTDRSKSRVKIKMRSINAAADQHSRYNTKDFDLVESVVKRSKILNTDLAIVIKNSITSKYFIDKFTSTYNNIYRSNDEFVDIVELFNSNSKVINAGDFASKILKSTKPVTVEPILKSPTPKITEVITPLKGSAVSSPSSPPKKPARATIVKRRVGPPPPPPAPNKTGGTKPVRRPAISRPVGPPPPPPSPAKKTGVSTPVRRPAISRPVNRSISPPSSSSSSSSSFSKKSGGSKPVRRPTSTRIVNRPGPPPPPPSPPKKTGGATTEKRTGGVKAKKRTTGKPLPPPPPPKP